MTTGARRAARIVVFGSINADLVARVGRFPGPGETVGDARFSVHSGGKGANQALAAALAGASVALFGCVGRDPFADLALAGLAEASVDLSGVVRVDAPTGVATLMVDDAGRNMIAVAAGANALADPEPALSGLAPGDWLVVQGELPVPATAAAIVGARAAGARVLLNLAPPVAIGEPALGLADCLVVNEHEASELAGRFALPGEPTAFAAQWCARFGALTVVTAGAEGAIVAERGQQTDRERKADRAVRERGADGERTDHCEGIWRQPAAPVRVVDSTGAGDAFVGVLAAALAGGVATAPAVRRAVAAGSLACEAPGARGGLMIPGDVAPAQRIGSLAARLPPALPLA